MRFFPSLPRYAIALAVLTRLLPLPPNLSPVHGALLYAGARLRGPGAVLYPLVLLAASDLVLLTAVYGRDLNAGHAFVWLGFAAVTGVGRGLRGRARPAPIVAAALGGPVVFYLVSNFGVWLEGLLYPRTASGLMACYVAGLPFLRNSLIGTAAGAALFFGGEAILPRFVPSAPREESARATR